MRKKKEKNTTKVLRKIEGKKIRDRKMMRNDEERTKKWKKKGIKESENM